jgi:DNA-binding transcriptional regulator YiaG
VGLIEPLRRIWRVHNVSFRDFLADLGLSQSACARRFCVPLRTVQGWALGERTCPRYVRMMMAQLMGYAPAPEDLAWARQEI